MLHAGSPTAGIIEAYISLVKALRLLEPSGVLLHEISIPISNYLKKRADAVKCIVSGMIDDGDSELAKAMRQGGPVDPEDVATEDYNDEEWLPEPLEAKEGFSEKVRTADLVSILTQLFPNLEVFRKEFQTLIYERLITNTNYDIIQEVPPAHIPTDPVASNQRNTREALRRRTFAGMRRHAERLSGLEAR